MLLLVVGYERFDVLREGIAELPLIRAWLPSETVSRD